MIASRFLTFLATAWTGLTICLILTQGDAVLVERNLISIPSSALFFLASSLALVLLYIQEPGATSAGLSGLRANALPLSLFLTLLAVHFILAMPNWNNWEANPYFVWLLPTNILALLFGVALGSFRSVFQARTVFFNAAFAVLGVSIIIDVVAPGTFSTMATRAAGFARNANLAGFLTVVLLTLIISWQKPRIADGIRILCAMIVVSATLSRGGLILLGITVTIWVMRVLTAGHISLRLRPRIPTTMRITAILVILAAIITGVAAQSPMLSNSTTRARALRVASTINGLDPNEQRLGLVREYLGHIGKSPIAGHGTGYRSQMPLGPHNAYLALWVDNGVAGPLIFLAMLGSLLLVFSVRRSTTGIVLVFLTLAEGLFTHNLLDHRPIFLIFGLMLSFTWRTFEDSNSDAGYHATQFSR